MILKGNLPRRPRHVCGRNKTITQFIVKRTKGRARVAVEKIGHPSPLVLTILSLPSARNRMHLAFSDKHSTDFLQNTQTHTHTPGRSSIMPVRRQRPLESLSNAHLVRRTRVFCMYAIQIHVSWPHFVVTNRYN